MTGVLVRADLVWFKMHIVGPDPCRFSVGVVVLTVTSVKKGHRLHHGSFFQEPRLWILNEMAAFWLMVSGDVYASLDETVGAFQIPGRLGCGSRRGVLCAGRRGPDAVKVPRWVCALEVPDADVADEVGAALWVQIDADHLPAEFAEASPDAACAREEFEQARHLV